MSQLDSLLHELDEPTPAELSEQAVLSEDVDDQVIRARLGAASGLFAALQCKHPPTARHALRVALTCSAWVRKMELQPSQCDAIEVAALLHDVGVIGVPDHILMKPGALDDDEAAIVARSRRMSLEVLRRSCNSPEVLQNVEHVGAWYDGSRDGFQLRGDRIPLGARMIAVAEAFDAMTTARIYRPAMPLERAMSELFDCAGTQFDPVLVERFAELHGGDPSSLHREVAARWLQSLDPRAVDSWWQLGTVGTPYGSGGVAPAGTDSLFQAKLLESMYDAVVFIDADSRVTLWNRGAERLTGIAGGSICQRQWRPDLLRMADEKGRPIGEADCPVAATIGSGVQSLRRLSISGRTGHTVSVDTHTIPVIAEDGTTLGAILLFHDASSETSLEQRCQSLHKKATKDSLTQVANRAEFDRVHEQFVAAHQQQQVPCSLMICDLDRFKRVNDTYGHQAGDDVIKSLANLLKSSCRPGDLVARYGGEEFVVLCSDCDAAAAARRADQIRSALSQLSQPKMGGHRSTVSFGVTEIQPGDTPETMLRRADRALLLAKERGRDRVVQLGTGAGGDEADPKKALLAWKPSQSNQLIQRELFTSVPIKMAVEKLRGFVADHNAEIVQIDGDHVQLEIADGTSGRVRRAGDRPVTFSMDVCFEEERSGDDSASGGVVRTRIRLHIGVKKDRDRRRNDIAQRATDVLLSFRSYLMASDGEAGDGRTFKRVTKVVTPWLNRE